jgi:hypothetical protein
MTAVSAATNSSSNVFVRYGGRCGELPLALQHCSPLRRQSFSFRCVTSFTVILRPLDYGTATRGNQNFRLRNCSETSVSWIPYAPCGSNRNKPTNQPTNQQTKHIESAFSFYSNQNVTPAVNDLNLSNAESGVVCRLSAFVSTFSCGMNAASNIYSFLCLFPCGGNTMSIYMKTEIHINNTKKSGARGSAVGWGTMLQARRSRVRFPMRSKCIILYVTARSTHSNHWTSKGYINLFCRVHCVCRYTSCGKGRNRWYRLSSRDRGILI